MSSRGVNRVILVGNVGRDPEIRDGDRDTSAMATFNLATTEKYKDKETTEWHRCTAWGGLADVVDKYVRKGDTLCIVGRIRYREYEDRDGNRRWSTNIHVDELTMLGGGSRRDRDDREDDRPRSRDREDDRGNGDDREPEAEPDGDEPERGGATEDDVRESERPSGLKARRGREAGSGSGSSGRSKPRAGRAPKSSRGRKR